MGAARTGTARASTRIGRPAEWPSLAGVAITGAGPFSRGRLCAVRISRPRSSSSLRDAVGALPEADSVARLGPAAGVTLIAAIQRPTQRDPLRC
jgi:hypothetical protein